MVGEHDVEGEAADGSGDGDHLGGGLFGDLEAEARGDLGEERDERGCAFPGEALLSDVGGGFAGDLGEGGAGGVVGAFDDFAALAVGA